MVKERTVSVTRSVRPKQDKEKTTVIRYPNDCRKYREELLPIHRVQEIMDLIFPRKIYVRYYGEAQQ